MTSPPAAPDLLGPPRYTRAEVSALAGVDADTAARLWTAMGFPQSDDHAVIYTDADLEALCLAAELLRSGLVDQQLLTGLTRSMGQSLSRLAQTYAQFVAAHPDPPEEARAALSVPAATELVDYVWRRHLQAAMQGVARVPADVADAAQQTMVVGFADLDDFTGLSRQLGPRELSTLIDTFEDSTATVVTQGGGRVVKTGGDDVLFTCPTPEGGVDVALGIIERITGEPDLPGISIGMAYGPVLVRLGDVFGPVVNLASRLTALAKPGTVLADRDLADRLRDSPRLHVRPLRRRSVGGYGHLSAYRVAAR